MLIYSSKSKIHSFLIIEMINLAYRLWTFNYAFLNYNLKLEFTPRDGVSLPAFEACSEA